LLERLESLPLSLLTDEFHEAGGEEGRSDCESG